MPTRSTTLSYLFLVPWVVFAAAGAPLLTRGGGLTFRPVEQTSSPSVVEPPAALRVMGEPFHLLAPVTGEIIPTKSGNEAEVLFRWEGGATTESGPISLELSPGSSFPTNGTVLFP